MYIYIYLRRSRWQKPFCGANTFKRALVTGGRHTVGEINFDFLTRTVTRSRRATTGRRQSHRESPCPPVRRTNERNRELIPLWTATIPLGERAVLRVDAGGPFSPWCDVRLCRSLQRRVATTIPLVYSQKTMTSVRQSWPCYDLRLGRVIVNFVQNEKINRFRVIFGMVFRTWGFARLSLYVLTVFFF